MGEIVRESTRLTTLGALENLTAKLIMLKSQITQISDINDVIERQLYGDGFPDNKGEEPKVRPALVPSLASIDNVLDDQINQIDKLLRSILKNLGVESRSC